MVAVLKWLSGVVMVAATGVAIWLAIAPPELIRVGANYTAKMVCSNVVLAARDPQEVLAVDVQAPGHPVLRLMRVTVETSDQNVTRVTAGLLGFGGRGLAMGTPANGCTVYPDPVGRIMQSGDQSKIAIDDALLWPRGEATGSPLNAELDAILNDETLTGPGMRAIVVVKNGRIVAERYGRGFDAGTPLIGWSMTKTVTAALIGRAIREGQMDLDDAINSFGWTGAREAIAISDLMAMSSDLEWNEGYGSVSDVTRMLFLTRDMAGFVASMPLDQETPQGIGEAFEYSSGTTVLLSRIWQDAVGADALAFPRKALFEPLGMASAVMETDAVGTFVGSSYMYATARDWARFGLFLLQRGVWSGQSLLPVGYVDWMTTAHPASKGRYGNGHLWLRPANSWMEGEDAPLPADAFFLNGHDGQSVNVVPSQSLVVVRLGLTPSSENYRVSHLVEAVMTALHD